VFGTSSPTLLGLGWGILVACWVGLILGDGESALVQMMSPRPVGLRGRVERDIPSVGRNPTVRVRYFPSPRPLQIFKYWSYSLAPRRR
jgi:hypothetical protein